MIRSLLPVTVACAVLTCALPARAFEREWHLGAGVGLTDLTADGYGYGPEGGVHATYGLSDTFDLRLSARYAHLPLVLPATETTPAVDEGRGFGFCDLSAAYKIDILRAVPWIAGGVGYFHAFQEPLPGEPLARNDLHLVASVGLDYAVTRQLGLGATFRYGYLLAGSSDLGAQAYAEYRFGF